jgi:hypothetical protein
MVIVSGGGSEGDTNLCYEFSVIERFRKHCSPRYYSLRMLFIVASFSINISELIFLLIIPISEGGREG